MAPQPLPRIPLVPRCRFKSFGQYSFLPWTRLHVVITTLYFLTLLAFNTLAVVWIALRISNWVTGLFVYFLLTLGADVLAYTAACHLGIQPSYWFHAFILEWVEILYSMFACHAHPVFAALYYPLKFLLAALLLHDITRRIPVQRWTLEGIC